MKVDKVKSQARKIEQIQVWMGMAPKGGEAYVFHERELEKARKELDRLLEEMR